MGWRSLGVFGFSSLRFLTIFSDVYCLLRSDAPTSPQVNESLRTALAGVNAKLSQLRTENTVLQDASTRAKELAAEKSSVVKQHAALQKVSPTSSVERSLR